MWGGSTRSGTWGQLETMCYMYSECVKVYVGLSMYLHVHLCMCIFLYGECVCVHAS